jgi:hypothetical protein
VSRHTQFFAIDPEWGLLKNPLTPSRKGPPSGGETLRFAPSVSLFNLRGAPIRIGSPLSPF